MKNKIITKKKIFNDQFYRGLNVETPNYILNQYSARSSGENKLELHIDDRLPSSSRLPSYLLWGIPLIDTNEFNGSTIIVPKSHISGKYVPKKLKNHRKKSLNVKRGDVYVLDGRIWHGAHSNKSKKDRWLIFITFTRWHIKQTYNIPLTLPRKFLKNLDKKLKIILGYASFTKTDQRYGLTQRGDLIYANKIIKKIKNKSKFY